MAPKPEMICTACGNIGQPKKITKGFFIIEIVLWCFFIVPGLIYTVWRVGTRYTACPACKNPTMISLDSPIGRKMIADYNTAPSSFIPHVDTPAPQPQGR